MDGAGSSPEGSEQTIQPLAAPPADSPAAQRRPGRRDRVALACQCNGGRPSCTACSRLSLRCVYIVPVVPAAGEKKLYIKALEQKVAELETVLASLGYYNVGRDHFRNSLPGPSTSSQHSTPGPQPVQSSLPAHRTDDDDANDVFLAVRDLSLSASGHYVGASSNIAIGRVLSSVVHSQRNPINSSNDDAASLEADDPAPKSVCSSGQGEVLGVPFLTPAVAHRLMEGWSMHIATRYPVLHSAKVLALHNSRDNLDDVYEQSILHLVYAVSGRWLESSGEMGHFFSDQHYDIAFGNMDELLPLRDSRTVDYLLLMALYCTRAPRDPGAWTYVGAAMRLCIELGLHRRPRRQPASIEGEMMKRRFWTAYCLDRDISIAIGRPPSISDHDIDAEMPLDINEDTTDEECIRQASLRVSNIPANPPTSMTSFVHRLRLKRLESEIQHVVYRVDKPARTPDATINGFLDQLDAWKDAIPLDTRNYVHRHNVAYEGLELYTIHYYRCVRFLLYPQLAELPLNPTYLKLCADSCCGIIADYRRVHNIFPVGFSALSIQSVFLAGLTLIYCAWLAPPNSLNVEGPLTNCQILLHVVTERYRSARKYRDVFERIKESMVDRMAHGTHQPRQPVNLELAGQENFASLSGQWAGMGDEFTAMINTMTGTTASTPPGPFNMGMDPTAISMVSGTIPQATDFGQYQVWPGLPHVPGDMSGLYQ